MLLYYSDESGGDCWIWWNLKFIWEFKLFVYVVVSVFFFVVIGWVIVFLYFFLFGVVVNIVVVLSKKDLLWDYKFVIVSIGVKFLCKVVLWIVMDY